MARLRESARRGYVKRMADYLAESYRERVAQKSRPELEAWVAAAVAKAERYGVVMEKPVAQLMLLLLVLGDDADERLPWMRDALDDESLADLGKLRKLVALAREHAAPDIEQVTVVPEVCAP
jgi:hypothetical protein